MQRLKEMAGNKRLTIFWKFFSSFFIFILIPSIIASLFTYVYVVALVEQESERSSEIVIGHFAERTDEMIGSLEANMIKILEYSTLDRFLRLEDEQTNPTSRNEQLSVVIDQLTASNHSSPLVDNTYVYVVNHDMVIDSRGYFSKDVYFTYFNQVIGKSTEQMRAMFTGKQMMKMTGPQTIESKALYSTGLLTSGRFVSAVISYPFNSNSPKAYLVVNIDVEKLRKQITVSHGRGIETAIINRSGDLLAYSGLGKFDGHTLLHTLADEEGSKQYIASDQVDYQLLTHYSGRYDWIYMGLADLEELRRPGKTVQTASLILLGFFLLIGGVLSYLLSKRMYSPIRDIKNELATGRKSSGEDTAEAGDEFDLIKRWSKHLVSKNKDMSLRLTGMSPVVHEYFLGKVLLGELQDELAVEYYAKEIGFDTSRPGRLAVLCIEVQYCAEAAHYSETGKSFLLTDLKHKIERDLEGNVWLCQMRKDMLACVVHVDQPGAEGALETALSLRDRLNAELPRLRSTVGVGSVVTGLPELSHSYTQAFKLLRYKGFGVGVQICTEQDEQKEQEERSVFDGFLPSEKVNHILAMYKAGEYDSMLEIVDVLLESGKRSEASAQTVRQLCVDILNTWLRAVAADRKHDFSIEKYSTLFQELYECVTWDDIRTFFQQAAKELFSQSELDSKSDKFQAIADYIRDNFSADLTIEQLAREMNMSVGHFSRSFKDALGEKYIEYLTRCRLEAGKKLLRETDMKIDDIAAEVGYLGRNSFIKTFRKYESVTPGKYREAYRTS